MNLKKIVSLALGLTLCVSAVACSSDADVASKNLSKDADNFKIPRSIVFYNGITGDYILQIEGYCSLGNDDPPNRLSVTCKVGDNEYKKHFLGLSDNVTYFAEQLSPASVSTSHYKIIFKPSTVLPDIEAR